MKYFFVFILTVSIIRAQTPDWAWARHGQSTSNAESRSMVVDGAGNVYVTGYFTGTTLNFSSTALSNSSSGTNEFFLVKYDRAGNLQWAKKATGDDDDEPYSVAVDPLGNIYVAGFFESTTITFGTTVLTNNSNTGFADIFLVKYNPSGNVLWAQSYGGPLQDIAYALAVDNSGNSFLTGEFNSLSVQFDNFGVINSGGSDAFLSKISVNGAGLWAKRIGGGNMDAGMGVATDTNGNVFVSGEYNSTSINTYAPNLTNAGGYDIFYAKYDAAGNNILNGRFGNSGNERIQGVTSNSAGNFYLAGTFDSNSLTFGSTSLSGSGSVDLFFVKLSSAAAVQWAVKTNGSTTIRIGGIASDNTGNLFATGTYNNNNITFGSNTPLALTGGTDAFLVKLNVSNGAATWSKKTASAGFEKGGSVGVDNSGRVHLTGGFTNTISLRDNYFSTATAQNIFTTKLCIPPSPPVSATSATVCSGSSGTLNATTPSGMSATWFAAQNGGTPLATGSKYVTNNSGTYYVASLDTAGGCGISSDSRVSAGLNFHPSLNLNVSLNGNTLIATAAGSVVSWYNCQTNTKISGQQNSNFVITASGSYAVIMQSPQGCADTSACGSYSYVPGTNTVEVTTSLNEPEQQKNISIYPNPNNGSFTLRSSYKTQFRIVNILGETLGYIDATEENKSGIKLAGFESGIYFITDSENKITRRVIVSR